MILHLKYDRAGSRISTHHPALCSLGRRRHDRDCCLWVRCRQLPPPVGHRGLPVACAPHSRVHCCQRGQARCLQGALHSGAVHAAHQRRQQGATEGGVGGSSEVKDCEE